MAPLCALKPEAVSPPSALKTPQVLQALKLVVVHNSALRCPKRTGVVSPPFFYPEESTKERAVSLPLPQLKNSVPLSVPWRHERYAVRHVRPG